MGWVSFGEIILSFWSGERLGAEGGWGFQLAGEGDTSREVWIEALFGFFVFLF